MPPLNDIAAIVGIVGASVAATLAVVKYLDTRREKRRRITVTVTHGMPFNIPGVHNDLVLVEAANPGSQPVTLTSWGFLLEDGRALVSFAHLMAQFVSLTNCCLERVAKCGWKSHR